MKKLLFLVAFLATSMFASAQIYVGGGIGFNKSDDNGAKTTTYEIAPEVGYKLNDNVCLKIVNKRIDNLVNDIKKIMHDTNEKNMSMGSIDALPVRDNVGSTCSEKRISWSVDSVCEWSVYGNG